MKKETPYRIHAVLFDFDGTITKPGALDFRVIKRQLGCPLDKPVLEYIEAIVDGKKRKEAHAALTAFETAGAEASRPNEGAEDLLHYLKANGLPVGILTRNSLDAVGRAMKYFNGVTTDDFQVVITRDDAVAPKPDPEGVLVAAERMGVRPEHLLMIGDFEFDIQAGLRAGAVPVFLTNGSKNMPEGCTLQSKTLSGIKEIVRQGLALPPGKLPNDLLQRFLGETGVEKDPSVLIHPGIGEDTAAVSVADAEVITITTDPITFATDAVGLYAVAVNANDLATSGAVPRWMVTTLLFPVGATPSEIHSIMADLATESKKHGITLCGGHTEITDAVNRPVVVATMTGTVPAGGLVDKKSIQPGDRVLLTKAVAVEGTAIIAREITDRLKQSGMTASDISRCAGFLNRISILEEAKIAASHPGTSAMHDVTEGGLATAVLELSEAGGRGIEVAMDSITVYDETRSVCKILGLDPLGLIGSGSLLICCRESNYVALMADIENVGIPVSCIGTVTDAHPGVMAFRDGRPEPWPAFDRDEIARLFSE